MFEVWYRHEGRSRLYGRYPTEKQAMEERYKAHDPAYPTRAAWIEGDDLSPLVDAQADQSVDHWRHTP